MTPRKKGGAQFSTLGPLEQASADAVLSVLLDRWKECQSLWLKALAFTRHVAESVFRLAASLDSGKRVVGSLGSGS